MVKYLATIPFQNIICSRILSFSATFYLPPHTVFCMTFIEPTKGKSGLRANNKTLETLSKLNQEKKGNLESILLYWFTIDQMYVPP